MLEKVWCVCVHAHACVHTHLCTSVHKTEKGMRRDEKNTDSLSLHGMRCELVTV